MSDVALTPSKRDVNDLICLCLHLISWQMREQSCILLKKQSRTQGLENLVKNNCSGLCVAAELLFWFLFFKQRLSGMAELTEVVDVEVRAIALCLVARLAA